MLNFFFALRANLHLIYWSFLLKRLFLVLRTTSYNDCYHYRVLLPFFNTCPQCTTFRPVKYFPKIFTHTHTPRVYKPKFHGGGFDPLPKCSGRWVVDPTPGVGRPREFECSEIRQGNFHILTKEFHYLTSFLTAQRKFCDFNKENPLLLTDS